jgi:hypothetical protein
MSTTTAARTVRKQVMEAIREAGFGGRRFFYQAVLNPTWADEDAEDCVDIRALDEVVAEARPGDVVDVYVYTRTDEEWDQTLVDNVTVKVM